MWMSQCQRFASPKPNFNPSPARPQRAGSGSCSAEHSAVRRYLLSRGNSAIADRGFHWLMVLCALSIFGIVVLIAYRAGARSSLAWNTFGLQFLL